MLIFYFRNQINKEGDDNMNILENKADDISNYTVLAVPCDMPFIVTKEEAEKMLKNARKTPLTKEERAKIRKDAKK